MNNESRPHVKPGAIKYTKGYGRKVFFSKAINLTIILLSIIVMGLTIFVYLKQPVRTEEGFVQADPIHNRMPEVGEQVVIVETDTYHMFTPLIRAVTVQDVSNAEIVAGPYGEFKQPNENFVVVYADQTTTVNLEVDLEDSDEKYLDREYVVREIDESGNYVEGQDKIVVESDILGNIQNDINN